MVIQHLNDGKTIPCGLNFQNMAEYCYGGS